MEEFIIRTSRLIQFNIIQDIFKPYMSRYTEKKTNYKTKAEDHKSRFGFEYIKDNINYRTEIPALPEKPRLRPDEKIREKKVEEQNQKIRQLKDQRKEKKDKIKIINHSFDQSIQVITNKVELGKKCIEVLYSDLDFLGTEIGKVFSKLKGRQNKLDDCIFEIKNLKYQNKPQKKNDKTYEQMTIKQLNGERSRIEQKLTIGSLTKKEQGELNSLLTKIGRIKADTTRVIVEDTPTVNSSEKIEKLQKEADEHRAAIEKIKQEKSKLFTNREEIDWKIECIREDIASFISHIKEIAVQQAENQESKVLYEESKKLKEEIYERREQIVAIEKEFDQKLKEFEYEQEKIKWISWATKVQEEKREEWEAQKQERKRQKLKEKGVDKKFGQKKEGQAKEGVVEQKKEERKKFNRNQKQIDNVAFLIEYCKRLLPTNASKAQNAEKKAVNIQDELKKGAWAKEKGVEILKSKKNKKDDEEEPKYQRKKEQPKEEEEVTSSKFVHDFFVQNFFDNAKVIPPVNAEELEKVIKELDDKLQYYLSHPDEGVESKFEQDRRYVDKSFKGNEGKYTKTKGHGHGSKVINTEDFPSLA